VKRKYPKQIYARYNEERSEFTCGEREGSAMVGDEGKGLLCSKKEVGLKGEVGCSLTQSGTLTGSVTCFRGAVDFTPGFFSPAENIWPISAWRTRAQ